MLPTSAKYKSPVTLSKLKYSLLLTNMYTGFLSGKTVPLTLTTTADRWNANEPSRMSGCVSCNSCELLVKLTMSISETVEVVKKITKQTLTRDAFIAAKILKEGFRKVYNVWTKSHFSNFEVG